MLVVAAIALAASFDALRGESEPTAERGPPPAPQTTTPDDPAEAPALAGQLSGTLYFTDETCKLRAIALLEDGPAADPPNWDECRFVLSPDGRRVSGAGTGWAPRGGALQGRLFQSADGTIQVSDDEGPVGEAFAGTAPAWMQDGTLTYFADGAVREWPSGDVVLSQRDLVRALPELATRYDRFRVREAAWLDDRRLAAILSAEGPEFREDMLAIYDGTELAQYTFDGAGGLSELRVSPGGRYAAAKSTGGRDAPGGFVMIEAGRELNTPRIAGYRTIAWSPDDQWAAVAADGGVFVFQPGLSGPPAIELALDARDLDWRGELAPEAVAREADTREASALLTAAGADGRLLVTQPDGGGCRLRGVEIPSLAWAQTEPSLGSPCRFTVTSGACKDLHCAFAPAADGSPTFVSGGELFAGRPDGRAELLVSAADLERILGRPAALEEVAWVDDERFWAVVRTGETATVALMTADGLVGSPWFGAPSVSRLRLSSSGMAAVSSDRGVVFFDSDGGRALTFTNGRDVTWAPGGDIAAVSTPREVIFVEPGSGARATLPLAVRDLAWVSP